MSDLSSSLKEIFNERITSPFYGSLIVSWLLWNWKIPYVTFFVDQDRLVDCTNKIDYILKYCSNPWHLAVFPVLSAVVIVVGMPYITNGASWITEIYDTWRINKKNEVQGKRLLTVQESLKLRIEIRNQEEEYNDLFTQKDVEIKSLKQQLELVSKQSPDMQKQIDDNNKLLSKKDEEIKSITKLLEDLRKKPKEKVIKDNDYLNELTTFLNNALIRENFEKIVQRTQLGNDMGGIPNAAVQFCIAFDLLENKGKNIFILTERGKLFLKEFLTRKIKPK